MEKEQLYQTIEAYLDGELGGEELTAFERELATDQTLAQEVALHRGLQQQLGDGPKMDLRATLTDIGDTFSESDLEKPDSPSGPDVNGAAGQAGGLPFWAWGLAFFLVIGGGVSWYLLTMEDDTVSALPPQTTEPEQAAEVPVVPEETPASDDESEDAVEEAPQQTTAPPQRETPAEAPRPQAYGTNRTLELLISDEPPSSRYEFTKGDLAYNPGYITFSSNLSTAWSVEDGFFLTMYNNQYPEGQVFRGQLTVSEVPDDPTFAGAPSRKDYVVGFTGETTLEPALYYGVVTNGKSSIPLWVGKVSVQ